MLISKRAGNKYQVQLRYKENSYDAIDRKKSLAQYIYP